MRSSHVVAIVGMICVTVLGVADLYFKGPDSAILSAIVAAVSGIAGYVLGGKRSGRSP
jgi:hypothetical protein